MGDGSLNIVQIISGREINGAVIYCKLLIEQLTAQGHRVWLVCRADSWLMRQDLNVTFVESNLNRFPTNQLREIAELIRFNKIDVVHTHMSRAHAFGTLLKLKVSVPIIKTAHSRSFQLHWQVNDFVIANSMATERYHAKTNRIPQRKIQTIHCFIDSKKFQNVTPRNCRIVRRQLRWNNGEFLIGIVGQVIARKGHQHLLEALPELLSNIPNARLVILGRFHRREPYVKRLRQFLVQNQLQGVTRWTGIRENIQDFLAAMDVCVVPSLEEPLGLVAIESQTVGTPVVATRVGGLPEIVEHESTGLLVPPRDASAIAKSIIRIADDEPLRRRLVYRGRKQVNEKFCPQFLLTQIEDVYQRLISRKKNSAAKCA